MRDIDVVSLREGTDVTAAESSAARSAGKVKVATSTPAAKAAPGNRAPDPKKESVPPSLRSKKSSAHLPFFEVDVMPYQPPSSPPPQAKSDSVDEPAPDSGLVDLRGMIALEQKAQKETRADADLFNLSGGLFSNVPVVPLSPPDLGALSGPMDTGRLSSVGRPPASIRVAPVFLPSASPTSQGRRPPALAAAKLSARVGWAVALISAGTAVVLISLKLGASLGADESGSPDAGATATATAAGAGAEATPPRETAVPGSTGSQATSSSEGPARKPSASPSAGPRLAPPATPATAGAAPGKAGAGAASPPGAPPAPAAPPPSPPSAGAEFNVAAAKAALIAAAGSAMGCKKPDDPSGSARVSITFAPSGRVTSARVTGPPFQGTPTGGCVASSFRGATVPPFDGSPVTVTKEVSIR